ncbi:MAG: VanZ family protein [Chloroflexi bacterium]|nr:VanZ family protein [Chloroflexota bacterium]
MSGWLPVAAWAALIFVASATPDLRLLADDTLDTVTRKVGHMAVFGVLALFVWRALAMTWHRSRLWAWAAAVTILYAWSDEVHQGSVAGRNASIGDVAIDAAGALIAVGLVWLVRSRRARDQPAQS